MSAAARPPFRMDRTPTKPDEVTGKAVTALVFSVLGLAGWCACVGSILGILLGMGERSGVGRAAVILGWIGLGLILLAVLVFGGQLLLMQIADHL